MDMLRVAGRRMPDRIGPTIREPERRLALGFHPHRDARFARLRRASAPATRAEPFPSCALLRRSIYRDVVAVLLIKVVFNFGVTPDLVLSRHRWPPIRKKKY